MLLLRTLGTNFWFPPKKSKPCSDLPPLCRPASGPAAKSRITQRLQFRRGPRNRSCSLDVYLLSQRMLNFFIGLMLDTPFGFLLLYPSAPHSRTAWEPCCRFGIKASFFNPRSSALPLKQEVQMTTRIAISSLFLGTAMLLLPWSMASAAVTGAQEFLRQVQLRLSTTFGSS